jgi:hypothetical protein
MKIRKGFVSNSSSSSFIVISSRNLHDYRVFGDYVIGDEGECEFGWDVKTYYDIPSKINFTYMQAKYVKNDNWLNMLYKVIKEHTGCDKVRSNLTIDWTNKEKRQGYIDHQSASIEGENTEIFESPESLKNFLFSSHSYIETGNDNDNTWEY